MSFTFAQSGAPADPVAPPWREARYRKMLAAAMNAFRGQSPEAVSMDDIARAAGVGKATLYRYFASKEALLRACLDRVVDEIGARMEEAESAPDNPPERLHRIVGTMVETFSRHLMPLRLISRRQSDLQEEWRQSVLDARRRLVRVLRRHFEAGAAAGWYVEVDRDLVPHMIMGMIRSGVTHAGGRTVEEMTDGICAFVLRACLVDDVATAPRSEAGPVAPVSAAKEGP